VGHGKVAGLPFSAFGYYINFCVYTMLRNRVTFFVARPVHREVLSIFHLFAVREVLIPWSRVLSERLPGYQLVKKFTAFYGTGRFITAFARTHHLSLY
jgi:hypothetical protein